MTLTNNEKIEAYDTLMEGMRAAKIYAKHYSPHLRSKAFLHFLYGYLLSTEEAHQILKEVLE